MGMNVGRWRNGFRVFDLNRERTRDLSFGGRIAIVFERNAFASERGQLLRHERPEQRKRRHAHAYGGKRDGRKMKIGYEQRLSIRIRMNLTVVRGLTLFQWRY